jgi:hypothetical protein
MTVYEMNESDVKHVMEWSHWYLENGEYTLWNISRNAEGYKDVRY